MDRFEILEKIDCLEAEKNSDEQFIQINKDVSYASLAVQKAINNISRIEKKITKLQNQLMIIQTDTIDEFLDD